MEKMISVLQLWNNEAEVSIDLEELDDILFSKLATRARAAENLQTILENSPISSMLDYIDERVRKSLEACAVAIFTDHCSKLKQELPNVQANYE